MNAQDMNARILAADDLKRQAVEVPEWGLTVYVQTLSGRARQSFEIFCTSAFEDGKLRDGTAIREHVIVLTACDATGEPIFTQGDIDALREKSGAALDRIYSAACALNGIMGAEAQAEKNLVSPDGSTSDAG